MTSPSVGNSSCGHPGPGSGAPGSGAPGSGVPGSGVPGAGAHCPLSTRLRVLAATPLFQEVGEDIADIERRMSARGFGDGEFIYFAGEQAQDLFIMAAGFAKVVRINPEGVHTIIDVLGPGDLFGGLAPLGVQRYAESVQVIGHACALAIDAGKFRTLLADYPQVAVRAFDEVAAQLHHTRGLFTKNSSAPLRERLAHVLLRLAVKFGYWRGDAAVIAVSLTRADLAAMTGARTESVSRIMSELRRAGIIGAGRKEIVLADPAALRALAHDDDL